MKPKHIPVEYTNGGELHKDQKGNQKFIQRPKGWTPTGNLAIEKPPSTGPGGKLPGFDGLGVNVPGESGASTPFSNKADFETKLDEQIGDLNAQKEQMRRDKATAINAAYEPRIGEAIEYREDITDATEAAMATKRRFSTAALGFVDFRRGEAQKIVHNLEKERDAAIATGNLETEQQFDQKLRDWKNTELQLADLSIKISINKLNEEMARAGLKLDQSAEQRAVGADERAANAEARAKFTELINMGTDFTALGDEDKQAFADAYGVAPEAAESTFTMLKAAQDAAKENDEIIKMKNLYSLFEMVPEGQEIPIGDETYKGMKSNNENMINFERVVGNKKYYVMHNKLTGEETVLDMGAAWKPTAGKTLTLDEAIRLGDPTLAGKPYNAIPEDAEAMSDADIKDMNKYENDLANIRGRLAADLISWDEAFNLIAGEYGVDEADYELLEQELQKDKYGGHTGKKKGEAFQFFGKGK